MNKLINILLAVCIASGYLQSCTPDTQPEPKPGILSFAPGTATAGDPVKIMGSNFKNVTGVSFGGSSAASFKIISDSVIFAYPGSGASGSVTVTSGGGNTDAPGFTYYTPLRFEFTGTAKIGAVPWPQMDSSFYSFITVQDSGSFFLKFINRYDTPSIRSSPTFPEYSRYVDSPGYVIFSGAILKGHPFSPNLSVGGYQFTAGSASKMSVFAKIQDTLITIPKQYIDNVRSISGSGVIKNNKITLQYLSDYRGSSKAGIITSQ